MPYKANDHLPESVKGPLPSHAQNIYREAFNHAFTEYASPHSHNDPTESAEVVAHKVAWAAVKKKYHKKNDKWEKINKS